MTDGIQGAAASVAHVVRELRPVGIATVMWTVVVCVALWHTSPEIVREIWPVLYKTWLGLVAGHVGIAAVFAVWERSTRPTVTPEISVASSRPSADAK